MIQPGQSFGKFYLVQTIGEGGTSRIFKALQQPINRLVALKIPSFSDSGSILTPDEFLSEATLMARLEHPNVVRIYDFGVSEERAFICMEYVEGWNLLELCQSQGPLSLPAAMAVARQTLDALLYSHSQGVLHLDLSPANVLIAKSGIVKLLYFGMAGKKLGKQPGKQPGKNPLTGQAKVIGTPAFLSPEHIHGEAGTPQSDLFSFGSLLYFAASGEPLFDPGEGNCQIKEMLEAIEAAREHPPENRIRRLPPALAHIVTAALTGTEPDRIRRELAEAWEKLEGGSDSAATLKREMHLDRESRDGDLPTDEDLRQKYFRLRDDGRHREAVALLEKALRRQPDNPMLQELLATPPAKVKTAPATMAVGIPGAAHAGGAAAPVSAPLSEKDAGAGPYPKRRTSRLTTAALGILAVTVAFLAWDKTRTPPANRATDSNSHSVTTAGAVTYAVPVQGTEAKGPSKSTASEPAAATGGTVPGRIGLQGSVVLQGSGSPHRHRSTAATSHSAALALSGPAGTHVSLNDSVEWISPSPEKGWPLQPGLINLTLTVPGQARPISSSLYVSADTLYLIRLDGGGGFSVSRGRR